MSVMPPGIRYPGVVKTQACVECVRAAHKSAVTRFAQFMRNSAAGLAGPPDAGGMESPLDLTNPMLDGPISRDALLDRIDMLERMMLEAAVKTDCCATLPQRKLRRKCTNYSLPPVERG